MGEMNDTAGEQVDNIWSRLEQGLLSATGRSVGGQRKTWRKQKWWWNEKMKGGGKDKYLDGKEKV